MLQSKELLRLSSAGRQGSMRTAKGTSRVPGGASLPSGDRRASILRQPTKATRSGSQDTLRSCIWQRYDTLFRHIAALASASGLSMLRKARFSALLYQLFYEAFPVYDARRAAQCRNATPVVPDGFLHAGVDEETLQAVLLCRLYDAYPGIEDDETDDGLVHACFSRWAASLSPFGFWPGVDDAQAWGRIGLMSRHASMYGGGDYCSVIRLARSCYESRLSCADVSPSVLCRAYDAIALGDVSPDNEALLRSLADRLCVLSTSYAPGSGESLLSLACCAEELCRRILGREEQTIGIGSYSEEAIP